MRTDDEELQCIALGHDVVEDCSVTYVQLREAGMSERVVNGIRCLTKIPGESYEEYKCKVKGNPDSVQVKLEDIRDKSDIRRLKGIRQKDKDRLLRHHEFWIELKAVGESVAPPDSNSTQ